MTTSHSTARQGKQKPERPTGDFPLFAHCNGSWAKKIRGKLHYFGPWADPQAALDRYLKDKPYLEQGKTPPPDDIRNGVTLRVLVNRFLSFHEDRVHSGEISIRFWRDYYVACERVLNAFGPDRLASDLSPDDFEQLRKVMGKTLSQATIRGEIIKTKALFRYAYDQELIDRPVRYGQGFKSPGKQVVQRERAAKANGLKMFEADEIQSMLAAADPILKAMILLGANTGMGNHDLGTLPIAALDLENGWHTHARPKTGTPRRCPLWPETIEAVKAVLAKRRKPKDKDDADLVFITRNGHRFVRVSDKSRPRENWKNAVWIDSINLKMDSLLNRLGIKRPGLNFYGLRHSFRTIADEALDQPATYFIMGHKDPTMAACYRERIDDSRLRRVADHVHAWLFPTNQAQ
jgi:integrase